MTKDIIYITLILIASFGGLVINMQERHKSNWCDAFYNEFRK